MADATSPPPASGLSRETEEEGFYHEAALNASWTAARLAVGGLCFLFGSFIFAYFYLRSLNSSGRWLGPGYHPPSTAYGTVVMIAVLLSAGIHYAALQQIKAGHKQLWQIGAVIALLLGLAAIVLQILELLFLPFWPGSSGFSSVFTRFYPVLAVVLLAAMIWLETLLARARFIPAISFVEQPPTYKEAFMVQRFQASLSGFTVVWNFLAVVTVVFWVLFYVIP
jgi:heme/copper-type cytochrome/quinol oxidase subunit 3